MENVKNDLYQITNQYRNIENQLIESGGELTPELEELLDINEHNREDAVRNILYLKMEKDDDIEALKSRKKMIDELIKKKETSSNSYKRILSRAVETFGELEVDGFRLTNMTSKSTVTEGLEKDLALIVEYLKDKKLTDIIQGSMVKNETELQDIVSATGLNENRLADISMLIYDKRITQSVQLSLKPDKTELKKYLKDNSVQGVYIQEKLNLQIK